MATRPSQEDSPNFFTTLSPFPPVPPVPPEKVFFYRLPIGQPFRGLSHFILFYFISFHFISFHFISFHLISSHLISSHLISFIYFCSSQHQHFRRRSDHSSTQRPGDRLQDSFPICPFFPSYVNDGTAGLYHH